MARNLCISAEFADIQMKFSTESVPGAKQGVDTYLCLLHALRMGGDKVPCVKFNNGR